MGKTSSNRTDNFSSIGYKDLQNELLNDIFEQSWIFTIKQKKKLEKYLRQKETFLSHQAIHTQLKSNYRL